MLRAAAARQLRQLSALEGPALSAGRCFSTSHSVRLEEGDAAGDALEGAAAAAGAWPDASAAAAAATDAANSLGAAADGVVAAAGGVAGASSEIGSILGATCAAVDTLHAFSGLPWWATIAGVGVLARAAMLPVSLRGMKASAAFMPLLRQAREEVAASMRPPPLAAPPPLAEEAARKKAAAKQQKWERAAAAKAAAGRDQQQQQQPEGQLVDQQQQQEQDQQQQQGARAAAPSNAAILARFHQLRRAAGAPSPLWVLASPLAQLPVFITSMATVRTMSLTGWPGFASGGTAWFPDLTQPAMSLGADVAAWAAPMGMAGAILPAAIAVAMFANIDAAFTVPSGGRQQASVMLWLTSYLRLFMEWMCVPIFAIAMQLPQGALCYWVTSSTMALAQNYALKMPAVRRAVGLPVGGEMPALADAPPLPAAPAAAAASAAAAVATGTAGGIPAGVDPELRRFLQSTSDQGKLFERAAELRAEGRAGATSTVLQRLLQLYPGQPNALYALGQVHAALKDWQLSEQYYLQAARSNELDSQMRARAWFGAAVAQHMQGESEAALDAFEKAADAAQSDDLRVRSWVAQATLQRKLGDTQAAVGLLRRAARAEPRVEEAYLRPLLAELAGQPAPTPGQAADEAATPAAGQPAPQLERVLDNGEQQQQPEAATAVQGDK